MKRTEAKIIDITGFSIAQIESGLTTFLSDGWILLQIVTVGASTFAVLSKEISL